MITLVAGYGVVRVPTGASILQAFMADTGQYQQYQDRAALLGGDSDDLLLVATREKGGVVTPTKLDAIRSVANELKSLPEIERVQCLSDAFRMQPGRRLSAREIAGRVVARRKLAQGDVPTVGKRLKLTRSYWPLDQRRRQAIDLKRLKQSMLNDEFVTGRLVSPDGMAQAMLVKVSADLDRDIRAQMLMRERIESICIAHGLGTDGVFTAGVAITNGWCFAAMRNALFLIFPVGAVIAGLVVYALFRRVSIVILTMLIAFIAIVWAVGATAFIFKQLTILVAGVPLLVLVISTSDVVHLTSGYYAELRSGVAHKDALVRVMREVGGACILTSVTTFVGFFSLIVIPAATIRHVAVALSVGTASALLLTLTVTPIFLSLVRPTDVHSARGISLMFGRLVVGLVQLCRCISLRHPKTVVLVHLGILALAALAASRVRVEPDVPSRFPSSHPLRQSIAFFNDHFSGASSIEVFFRSDPDRLLSPETIEGLVQVEKRLEDVAGVESVQSLATLFQVVDRSLGGPGALPATRMSTNAHIDFARGIDRETVRAIIAPSCDLTRMSVQVTPTSLTDLLKLADRIDAVAREAMPRHVDVDTSGFYTVLARSVDGIVTSEYRGFAICFTSVTIIMALGLRSFRLGMVAIVPNIVPLFALVGLVGAISDTMDSDLIMVAIVSLGLAIDDTTHFLHRYGIEMDRSNDVTRALDATFQYTGRAVVQTTLILSVGLMPFAFCEYFSLRMLGTYLVFVLFCALLSDLLLLPSIIVLFRPRGRARSGESTSEACSR